MEKTIIVSDEFVEIYKKFNVVKQTQELKKLSRKELFLILIVAIDSFSEENNSVIENFRDWGSELQMIGDYLEDRICLDKTLIALGDETGEKYIDISSIRDRSGNKLPNPLSEEEALHMRRDIGINIIIE